MQLQTFKTLWGYPHLDELDSLRSACVLAKADGFDGVEGPIPAEAARAEYFADSLQQYELAYIAEICTAGSYVPDRRASVAQHLQDLQQQLDNLGPMQPLLVNCLGGCDAWSLEESLRFFNDALEIADRVGVRISFETHRGRSLYSPWVTEQLLARQSLPLTCDFSHWCVVCEGLSASEDALLQAVAEHAVHVHGRIGYDQGPQISDLDSALFKDDIARHWQWWQWIWTAQRQRQLSISTFTPEFGPDGYQQRVPQTGEPVGDLRDFNRRMAAMAREQFCRAPDV